jgi:predicted permease
MNTARHVGWHWLEQLLQDVRFGARMLAKSPAMAAVGILTLALATGATTAIFSVLNGVVLRPLPFGDPERLVQVYGRNWSEDRGAPDAVTGPVSSGDVQAFSDNSQLFDGFAAYALTTRHVETPSGTERLNAVMADGNLFAVLAVGATLGRTFTTSDGTNVVVIGRRLWRERFGSDPAVAGRGMTLDGQPFTIVGVAPEWFQFPYGAASVLPGALNESRTDLWMPLPPLRGPTGELRRGRASVVARLKPRVSLEQGLAELRSIARRLDEESSPPRRVGVRVVPLHDVVTGDVKRSLWMLLAAVLLVLGVACVNMANLLLARLMARTREVVTRAALGASRARLVRQFFAESLLLSLLGGLAGLGVAGWGTAVLVRGIGSLIPRAHEIQVDWTAFVFLLTVCAVAATIFGLAPAALAARMDVSGLTREAGGTSTPSRRFARLRDALVVVEVTLAFVLMTGACLMVREMIRLRRVDTGMAVENVVALHLSPRVSPAEYYAIEERIRQLPGVREAGFIQMVPLQNWGWQAGFEIPGRPSAAGERRTTELRYVTPGYFRAAGIPLRRGRFFTIADAAGAPAAILVNEALVRRYLSGLEPIGTTLDRGTIVGVVGDVHTASLDRPAEPEIYYPAAQNVAMTGDLGMSLIVRTAVAPPPLIASIRAAVLAFDRKLAIFNVRTMAQVIDDSLWELNLYRWLIGLFALLALVLATIGLYGVITYMASARTREFAIRRALGSNRAALGRLVLGRGFLLTVTGLALGAFTTWIAATSWRTLPIASGPDAATYAIVSTLLLAVGLLAGALPAWRSASVDPIAALRHE